MKKWKELQQKLQERQLDNGMFTAAPNSKNELMTKFIWLRDCANIYPALDEKHKEEMRKGFFQIYQNDQKSEKFNLKKFDPKTEHTHIHPLRKLDLSEIDQTWSFIQNDAVGQNYEMLSKIQGFTMEESYSFLKYLAHVNFPYCKGFGMWEEGPKEVRASSLAQCIRGIEANEKRFRLTKKSRRLKEAAYSNLKNILENGETKRGRDADIALATVLYPNDLDLSPELKEIQIQRLKTLEGEWGLKRYVGDPWNGLEWSLELGREMQWPMGLALMYLITNETHYIKTLREIHDRFDYIPEGIIDGESNGTDLTEALAFYTLAEKQAKG